MSDPIGGIPSHLLREQTPAGQGKNVVGKEDFMKLLMAQLQNQDPLKPMDAHDFSAQLAQFSQLEQLTNIGTGIKDLKTGAGEGAKLQAMGMIGKRIAASGTDLSLVEGNSVAFQPMLGEGAIPSKAEIFDASGKLVRELDLTHAAPGGEVTWDGKDTRGNALPSGHYAFRVFGSKGGQPVTAGTDLSGKVVGIEMSGATPMLLVQTSGGGQTKVDLNKVRQVSVDTDSPTPQVAKPPPPKNEQGLPAAIQNAMANAAPANEENAEAEESAPRWSYPNLYGPGGFGGGAGS